MSNLMLLGKNASWLFRQLRNSKFWLLLYKWKMKDSHYCSLLSKNLYKILASCQPKIKNNQRKKARKKERKEGILRIFFTLYTACFYFFSFQWKFSGMVIGLSNGYTYICFSIKSFMWKEPSKTKNSLSCF